MIPGYLVGIFLIICGFVYIIIEELNRFTVIKFCGVILIIQGLVIFVAGVLK